MGTCCLPRHWVTYSFSGCQCSTVVGLALGIYVAAMGLFSFGCAAGNCTGPNCALEPDRDQELRK
jgi:hypothetical protein